MNFKKKVGGGGGFNPCYRDDRDIIDLEKCKTFQDLEQWKTTVNKHSNEIRRKYPDIHDMRFENCRSLKYINMLNIYEMGIRAKVVDEPQKNLEAYAKFTEQQKEELEQKKQDFTIEKQRLEALNSKLQEQIHQLKQEQETKTQQIQQHNSEIAKLQQTITRQTTFNCYKKGDDMLHGWDKKTLKIIGEGSQRKISWDGRQGQNKDLVLDANTEIKINEMHVVINSKNYKGKSIMTLHLKADPVNPNDLFYLYARVSGALESLSNTTGAGGGKKLSHYKKTKNRKFNSLSNKSRTKKRKKSKKRKSNKKNNKN